MSSQHYSAALRLLKRYREEVRRSEVNAATGKVDNVEAQTLLTELDQVTEGLKRDQARWQQLGRAMADYLGAGRQEDALRVVEAAGRLL